MSCSSQKNACHGNEHPFEPPRVSAVRVNLTLSRARYRVRLISSDACHDIGRFWFARGPCRCVQQLLRSRSALSGGSGNQTTMRVDHQQSSILGRGWRAVSHSDLFWTHSRGRPKGSFVSALPANANVTLNKRSHVVGRFAAPKLPSESKIIEPNRDPAAVRVL